MSRIFFDPPAIIAQRLTEPRKNADMPEASDAEGTMRYWDDYRARERAKLAEMTEGERMSYFTASIGEFPTPERLKALADKEEMSRLLDIFQKHGSNPDLMYMNIDRAYEMKIISFWEYRWLRLRRSLHKVFHGIWKRNVNSGERSVPRTRGMGKTESK